MKKAFSIPFILRSEGADPTSAVGGGSGHGGVDPITGAVSYSVWSSDSNYWEEFDSNNNNAGDVSEYWDWWQEGEFGGRDLWEQLNGNNPPWPGN